MLRFVVMIGCLLNPLACADSSGSGAAAATATAPALAGVWGGQGARAELDAQGAGNIQFDCAHAKVDALSIDRRGNLTGRGTFFAEHGGPVRRDEEPRGVAVKFSGSVAGDRMTLRIVSAADGSEEMDALELQRGAEGNVRLCR